jgi:hypothetical protein
MFNRDRSKYRRIGPLKPFLFSYSGMDGNRYSIVLYGVDAVETWKANVNDLSVLTYDGEAEGRYFA